MTPREQMMLAALDAIHAALSQPVQFSPHATPATAANLRGDATFARETADRARRAMADPEPAALPELRQITIRPLRP